MLPVPPQPFALRRRRVLGSVLVGCLVLLAGCPPQTPPAVQKASPESTAKPTATAKPVEVPKASDSAADVQALKDAGYLLKTNADGQVVELSIASTESIAKSLAHLSGVPNVVKALFTGTGVNDEGMENLASLKQIKDIDLSDSAIGDKTLDAVAQLSTLQALRLRRTGVSDQGLAKITGLPKLRAIDLRNSNTGDAAMAHLAKIKTLEDVQLEKAKVTDDGLLQLASLKLKGINVNYCPTVSNKTIAMLGKMPTLQSLQADYTKVNDEGIAALKALSNLKRLRVRGCDVTGKGLLPISGIKTLSQVELRDTSVDDVGMETLAGMPSITYLDISECRLVSSEGIGKLGKLTGLTYLGLWETKTDDATLSQFGGLVSLGELDLKACSVSDESLPVLLKMTSLTQLNVAGTQLSNDSFRELAKLPKLQSINVANTGIGFDVLDELAEKYPKLTVIEFVKTNSRRPADDELSLDGHRQLINLVQGPCIEKVLSDQLFWTCELSGSLSAEQVDKVHPPYRWTVRQVIEHCVDAERVFGYRMLRFAAGDQTPLNGFDENAYAQSRFGLGNMAHLVTEFGHLRQANITFLRRIVPAAWNRSGHVDGHTITVRGLAWLAAAHLQHHLEIIENRCDIQVLRSSPMDLQSQAMHP